MIEHRCILCRNIRVVYLFFITNQPNKHTFTIFGSTMKQFSSATPTKHKKLGNRVPRCLRNYFARGSSGFYYLFFPLFFILAMSFPSRLLLLEYADSCWHKFNERRNGIEITLCCLAVLLLTISVFCSCSIFS